MANSVRVLLFSLILGIVCAVLLTGTNVLITPYREANEKAEEVRNILTAVNAPVNMDSSPEELLEIFDRDIRQRQLGDLPVYEYVPQNSSGESVAVAVPFNGAGLWDPISGVLALEPDLISIKGVRFYKQNETPGLGGEISSEWFQQQFTGKKIVSKEGLPGFRIAKPGSDTDANSVDGITGATMTSDRVETMLDTLAKRIEKERNSNVQ